MDARGVERAALVAHSYGTSVAFQVALLAPERVSRIAVYDGWAYSDQLPTSFHWARASGVGEAIFGAFYDQRAEDKVALGFYDPEIIPQALVDTVEDQLARPGTEAAALAAVRAMRYGEAESRYSEIAVPVLLLWGREDTVTPLHYGERMRNDLPDASLEVFAQCGHFPMIEARRPSTTALLRFIDEGVSAGAEVGVRAEVTREVPEAEVTTANELEPSVEASEEGPSEASPSDTSPDDTSGDERPWYEQERPR